MVDRCESTSIDSSVTDRARATFSYILPPITLNTTHSTSTNIGPCFFKMKIDLNLVSTSKFLKYQSGIFKFT
eukprot:SAG31_NODE_2710_length_5214_cov_1.789628_7_plen_72_part_00